VYLDDGGVGHEGNLLEQATLAVGRWRFEAIREIIVWHCSD